MVLYRYERDNPPYYTYDPYIVILKEFEVIKETPKGFWVNDDYGVKKFVLNSENSRKRFAYETKEQALSNFIARTEKSIKLTKLRLNDSIGFLEAAKKINPENSEPKSKSFYKIDSFKDYPGIGTTLLLE